MAELSIVSPDGTTISFPLTGERVSLGRSTSNELCYPEDTGLSRQHLILERHGDQWNLRDPGSKNGTFLNGERISEDRILGPGDRILAGHLAIVYDGPVRAGADETVVFVEGREPEHHTTATVSTNLQSVVPDEKSSTARQSAVAASHVGALIKAGRELASHLPLDQLFHLILDLSIESVNAERGVLLTMEGESGELVVRAAKGNNFRISTGVRDRVLKHKMSELVNDVQSDERFRTMQSLVHQQVLMFMAVPLQTNDRVIGLIYVDNPQLAREFTIDDLNLLTVMANVAAIRIEHVRLAEIEQAEKIQAKDLEQAAIIQRQLLPSKAPVLPGLELAGYNLACRTVGGDYYDFLPYSDGRVALCLGDVSGKAMPAALLMTSLQSRVRVLAEDSVPNIAELMARLNRSTAAHCPDNRFISFFFAVFDPRIGELVYSNAGHNPPLLIRHDGSVERLETGGLLLGIFSSTKYEEGRSRMEAGDVLLIFSDGVTEATDPAGEEFEESRLVEVLRAHRHVPADEIVQAVKTAVTDWVCGRPFADDLTMVAAKRVA